MSRRKTKTERELNTDIHDTFRVFCNRQRCVVCKYKELSESEDNNACMKQYVTDIIDNNL